MITLYTHPMSPCAQKVRIVLAEKGLKWQAVHIDLAAKQNLTPEYLRLNPLGVVPTLTHNDQPVIESSIICEYLDDSFPEVPLKPDDPWQRSRMRFWMKHVDIKLHPSCGALQWPIVMRPSLMQKSEEERQRLLDLIPEKPRRERQKRLVKMGLEAPDVADAVRVYRNTIELMEQQLAEHPWLVSDNFSLADACVAPYFQTLHQFGWQGFFSDCPRVLDWYDRCSQRDSYRDAIDKDFAAATLSELRHKGATAWEVIERHLTGA